MKVYSIGRDTGCDIIVNDRSDVISRRHALISVANNGKITITDTSYNGTYVNGIRISPNVAVPVTRKDSVSFAHVAKLDWKVIPQPPLIRWGLPAALAVVVLIVVAICFVMCGGKSEVTVSPTPIEAKDSTSATPKSNGDKAVSDKTEKNKSETKQKNESKNEQQSKSKAKSDVKERSKKAVEHKNAKSEKEKATNNKKQTEADKKATIKVNNKTNEANKTPSEPKLQRVR